MRRHALAALVVSSAWTLACADLGEGSGDNHDTEIISRVQLIFTPDDGGAVLSYAFFDPDGDGGLPGEADAITLQAGKIYALRIGLLNELASPTVDIRPEIEAEAEQHMLFLADDAGLLSVEYADHESDYGDNAVGEDLPVGLEFTVAAVDTGSDTLHLVMRHLPPLNGTPQKSAELPQLFAGGEPLPGDADVDVSFALTVQ